MALRDLVAGVDGKLSHTKLWPNVASGAATVMFLWDGFHNQLTLDKWLAYMVCVGGYSVIITALALWKGVPPQDMKGLTDAQ